MKKYTVFIKLILIISFVGIFIGILINNSNLKSSIELYDNNFKALNLENNSLKKDIIAYKFNAEQLEYINDSIITALNNTRKELGIKDRQLKQMQNIKTEVFIKDSVFLRDTIFNNPLFNLDTLLGNDWYKIKLHLEYPSKINIDVKYKSDLTAFAYTSKEIVGTPKKCWLGRMFQKKYKVIRVEVNDKNPYSIIKEKKFIIVE